MAKIVEHKKQNRIRNDDEQWGPRRYVSYSPYASTFYLQEYLKKNTDIDNKISLDALIKHSAGLKNDESVEAFGREDAIKNKLTELTRVTYDIDEVIYNVRAKAEEGKRNLNKARVIFEDSEICIGIAKDNDERLDDKTAARKFPKGTRFTNIYYNHPFSYKELDDLIEAVQQSKALTKKESDNLIEKIKVELASDFYSESRTAEIKKFHEKKSENREITSQNIKILDKAIKENKKIITDLEVYNKNKKLETSNEGTILHPYYLVANNGLIYLIAKACWSDSATIWRVDLMRDIKVLEGKSDNKNTVADIPMEWDESWQYQHLNMTFGIPQTVRIRVQEYEYDKYGNKKKLPCTFLVDSFGDNFEVVKLPDGHKDKKEDHFVIEVTCAPFAIRNWALQFSDRVEVLPPVSENGYDVRAEVIKQLKMLNEKYGV